MNIISPNSRKRPQLQTKGWPLVYFWEGGGKKEPAIFPLGHARMFLEYEITFQTLELRIISSDV